MSGVDLTGPLLKLARAERHIDELRREIKAFMAREPHPHGFRVEFEVAADQTREYVVYAIIRSDPPFEWALIVGDAINNIRAALDHLVWTITPVKVRREFRNKIEFPIYTCRKAFVKHAAPKLEGLSPKHRALIENVQPYHGADPHIEPLEVLRRLSNTDKHRLLVSMATARNLEWVAEAGAKIAFTELSTVPLKDGAPVMRFTASPTTADLAMQVQAHAEFAIVIQDATRSQFPDAIAALHGLHWYARDWIIRHPLELGFDSKPLPYSGLSKSTD